MQYSTLSEPIMIMGIEIRTTNDNGVAFKDIPAQWQKVFQENMLSAVPHKAANEVYAVYTHFEHEGKNNTGMYSFIIGNPVTHIDAIPEGFVVVTIPAVKYQRFDVEQGHPEKVGLTWMQIWQRDDFKNHSCILDFERYGAQGEIAIFVGVK